MFVLLLLCFSNITHLAVESVYYQEWVTTLMMFDILLLLSVWSNFSIIKFIVEKQHCVYSL